jgi:hypothetical protein
MVKILAVCLRMCAPFKVTEPVGMGAPSQRLEITA